MTSTRPRRNVRNTTPAPIVEDDATIVRTTLDRLIYTIDVLSRFDRTRQDVLAVQRGETNKTMAQVMNEARWHEHATKAKKDCPLGSTKKKRYYTIEEETDSDEGEDDPNVPSTSAKKAVPEKKVPTLSKAKLAAMKKKEEAAKRKAEREAKKLEALNERDEDEREETEERLPTVSSSKNPPDLPTSSSTAPVMNTDRIIPEIKIDEYVSEEKKPEENISDHPVFKIPNPVATVSNTPASETTPKETDAHTKNSEGTVEQEEERMEVDEPMETITPMVPSSHELQSKPEDMEVDEAIPILEENTTVNDCETVSAPALELGRSKMTSEGESSKSPNAEGEVFDEPPVLEKMASPQAVQQNVSEASPVTVHDSESVVTQEELLHEQPADEKLFEETFLQQPLPKDVSTSEMATSQSPEESMDQASEDRQTETAATPTSLAPEVTLNATPEKQEVLNTAQEEVPTNLNPGSPVNKDPEEPETQPPEELMDYASESHQTETAATPTSLPQEVTSSETPDEMQEVTGSVNSEAPAIDNSEKPETQTSEEPMDQAETAETNLAPVVTLSQTLEEMEEVSETRQEEDSKDENAGTPSSIEASKSQIPKSQAEQVTGAPMALEKEDGTIQILQTPDALPIQTSDERMSSHSSTKKGSIQSPQLPEARVADAPPAEVEERKKPASDSSTLVNEPKEAVKPEPIASTSQIYNVNLDEIELPKGPPPKASPPKATPPEPIPECYRPWISPVTSVEIVNYENPEDAKYTPAERALRPWLVNDVPLYPLNLLPAIDRVPGRVWCPPRLYCRLTQQNVVAIGPLTELETLDTALTPEAMFLVEPDKIDLIMKRIYEIQMIERRRMLREPRLPHFTRMNFRNELRHYEEQHRMFTMKDEQFRYQLARSSDRGVFWLPSQSCTLTYHVFDHTWYTTNRRWFFNSQEHLSKKMLKDQNRNVEKNTAKFEQQILENAKKRGDESAEEKIRKFGLPLIHDLRREQPQVQQRMKIFRQKMALYFQYEDFEKCYLTDPGCREILKKLRPIPFNNGVMLPLAEKELMALLCFYKHRFALEHPVIQLYKAGNEKAPAMVDIQKIAKQCLDDVIDTVVFRDLTDLPTFPHRVPAHNNAIPKVPAQQDLQIQCYPLDYYGRY